MITSEIGLTGRDDVFWRSARKFEVPIAIHFGLKVALFAATFVWVTVGVCTAHVLSNLHFCAARTFLYVWQRLIATLVTTVHDV